MIFLITDAKIHMVLFLFLCATETIKEQAVQTKDETKLDARKCGDESALTQSKIQSIGFIDLVLLAWELV